MDYIILKKKKEVKNENYNSRRVDRMEKVRKTYDDQDNHFRHKGTMIPVVLTDKDIEKLDEFMKYQAGRTFDMRKPEHPVAHKILSEILFHEWNRIKHVPR